MQQLGDFEMNKTGKGYKFPKGHIVTPEMREKISQGHMGPKNPQWKGNNPIDPISTGHLRAKRLFGNIKGFDKHHIDGNPLNNAPENIEFLTRKEHMTKDGRIQTWQWHKQLTHKTKAIAVVGDVEDTTNQ